MQTWTARQRVAVAMLCGLILSIALGRYAWNHVFVSDPQPLHPVKEDELADRIDPNTADAATLSALPLIGEKKAQDIVKFRQRFAAEHPNRRAFERPVDLLLVHGIGSSTVSQLSPYLTFADRPTSKPAD